MEIHRDTVSDVIKDLVTQTPRVNPGRTNLSKIEVHHTPKHASWLNAAEIEINVMDIECTGNRIGSKEILTREVAARTERRNDQKKKINWKFTREKADKKLSKYHVP